MHRTMFLVSILAVMLLGSLIFTSVSPTAAQESTPVPEGLPIEVLGVGPSTVAPGNMLVLAEVTFPADFTETHPHVHPYDYVVTVQSGSYSFTIESGTLLLTRAGETEPAPVPTGSEITVGPGDSFAGTPDVVWGSEEVVSEEPFVVTAAILEAPGTADPVYIDATPGAAGTPEG